MNGPSNHTTEETPLLLPMSSSASNSNKNIHSNKEDSSPASFPISNSRCRNTLILVLTALSMIAVVGLVIVLKTTVLSTAGHDLSAMRNYEWVEHEHDDIQPSSNDLSSNKNKNNNNNNNQMVITFGSLAQELLPSYFESMLQSLNDTLTPTVASGDVALTRKTVLKTRDLLDVFAPILPRSSGSGRRRRHHHEKHTHNKKEEDAWWELRSRLDEGYESLGHFLDLDHSHVEYTSSRATLERNKVLSWKSRLDDYLQGKASSNKKSLVALLGLDQLKTTWHKKESHLFWDGTHDIPRPSPNEPAAECLRRLIEKQAKMSLEYLQVSLNFHSVLAEDRQEEYHNLRKVLRSMVDEYDMMGHIFDPNSESAQEMAVLRQARTSLGDLNDDYTAWDFYGDDKKRRKTEREQLVGQIEDRWIAFKEWATKTGSLEDSLMGVEAKMRVGIEYVVYPNSPDETDKRSQLPSFLAFLNHTRHRPTFHLAIGNEAGDADSVISAMVMAYLESVAQNNSHSEEYTTPIVSISREALVSKRPEIALLLQLAGISTEILLCVDDPILFQRDMSEYIITLTDHNVVEAKFQSKNWTVVEIVDHHFDQGWYLDTCYGPHRSVAFAKGRPTVASTCTLVAERLRLVVCPPYPAPIGILLLGVILLDSVNLSAEAGQVTQRDRDAVKDLLQNVEWDQLSNETRQRLSMLEDDHAPDTNLLFRTLQAAKYDPRFWQDMSVMETLHYDFKEYFSSDEMFGISTILMPLDQFLHKRNLLEGILQFMTLLQTDFLGIMLTSLRDDDDSNEQTLSSSTKGTLRRQLMVCGTHNFDTDSFVSYLLSSHYHEADLELVEIDTKDTADSDDTNPSCRCFEQHHVESSRKQIGLIFQEYFASKDMTDSDSE